MPRPPLSGPDSSKLQGTTTLANRPREDFAFETNLSELADRFAALVASPELSADLALQIVLNEIAEQACKATGATGAAIALQRNEELVCRASSGSTAPELGAPLNSKQGLSGECVRTRRIQICGDIENDSRADAIASRQLGVRSVIVLPLLRGADVAGVLEAFSTTSEVFGENEKRTLEFLAQRVLHNVELAAKWSPKAPAVHAGFEKQAVDLAADAGARSSADCDSTEGLSVEAEKTTGRSGTGIVITRIAGVAVLLIAIGLWARISQRLGWLGAGSRAEAVTAQAGHPAPSSVNATVPDRAASTANVPSASVAAGSRSAVESATIKKDAGKALPPGSLVVYENGKEVFRVPGGQRAQPAQANASAQSPVQQAVSIEPEAPESGMRVLPGAAGSSLVRRVAPEYPTEARQQNIQGAVVLDVRAGGDGSVKQVNIVSGDPLLAAASVAAVNQWRFRPQLVNGRATEIQTRITLNFKLPE